MTPKRCIFLSYFCLFLFRGSWATTCLEFEKKFTKVQPDGLSTMTNPLSTVTASKRAFCSMECADTSGCNSFIYKTKESTNNCLLSSSEQGEATDGSTEVEIYKVVQKGCRTNPCQNGGTCQSTCEEPFYKCSCPANAEGVNCEWNLDCFLDQSWLLGFDDAGWVFCYGDSNYLAGLHRSEDGLNSIEHGWCCPMPLAFSKDARTCYIANWWETFAKHSWSYCNSGYFINGFYRNGGTQELGYLEEAECCKPVSLPNSYTDCYYENVVHSFDNWHTTAKCTRPQYYMIGIRTTEGTSLSNIEEFHCCKMG